MIKVKKEKKKKIKEQRERKKYKLKYLSLYFYYFKSNIILQMLSAAFGLPNFLAFSDNLER